MTFEETLKSSTLWKVIATIMAFVWILNLFPTWFGTQNLPGVKSKEDYLIRLLWAIPSIIFWIPGIIVSIKWIWFDK